MQKWPRSKGPAKIEVNKQPLWYTEFIKHRVKYPADNAFLLTLLQAGFHGFIVGAVQIACPKTSRLAKLETLNCP